jgi:peptide deformylase
MRPCITMSSITLSGRTLTSRTLTTNNNPDQHQPDERKPVWTAIQDETLMAVMEVIRMGHPTLRQVARRLTPADWTAPDFPDFVEDMRETLHAAGGIGLAAPQVDRSIRLAVIEIDGGPTRYGELAPIPFAVYINPRVTILDDSVAGHWEGCLSVPGMMGHVERPQHIQVDYLTAAGEAASITAQGFLATVFQHEFDHLDGTLYVDRLSDPTQFAFDEEYRRFVADDE